MSRSFPSVARVSRACGIALAIAAASVAYAEPARADTSDQVNTLFKRGVDFYKEADFRAALVEFKRAYDASNHDYRVLYNIAQCEYQLTNYVGALSSFERFLADGGAQVKDERRGEVLTEIAKLKGRVGLLTVKVEPAGAKVTVDGEAVTKTDGIKLNPGGHKVEVTESGYDRANETVEIGGGDVKTVEVKLKPGSSPAPARGTAPEVERNWTPPVVAFAVAGGLAVGTVVFGILTTGKESSLAEAKAKPDADPANLKSLDSNVGTFAIVTDIFLGATIVAAGVGTYLTIRTLTDGPEKGSGTAKSSLKLVPSLGGGVLMGSF